MPLHTGPVAALAAKQAASPSRMPPSRTWPQRGAMWHVLQLKAAEASPRSAAAPTRSGLPAALQAGTERLSGFAMDDVRVHRDSPEPAKLGALAFTRGADIHLGPGQERHLPHEAWHVVQQKQGRVAATRQLKGDAQINDDGGLEREADLMGARALAAAGSVSGDRADRPLADRAIAGAGVAQCFGAIRFANVAAKPKYQEKAADIVEALQNTPSVAAFLADKNTLITLENDPLLASVRTIGDQVQITLSPWFFEQESRGRILGMLAHEFGVHPLATKAMSVGERTQEQLDITGNTAFATGVVGHTVTPGAAGQTDHIFASVAGQPRFVAYRKTVYEMALAMLQQTRKVGATVREAHVKDAIMTYLSDIAMILATNDQRSVTSIHSQADRIATIFNLERTRWINSLTAGGDDNHLVRLTPGAKTAGDVRGEVRSLIGSRILSLGTSSASSDRTKQAPIALGGVAPLTAIQQEVLVDYGLILAAVPAGNSLFDALDTIHAPNNARITTMSKLALTLPGDPAYALVTGVLNEIRGGAFNGAVSAMSLDIAAQGVARTIRVIEPNGKISISGNHGATVTVLRVEKPASHYRSAS